METPVPPQPQPEPQFSKYPSRTPKPRDYFVSNMEPTSKWSSKPDQPTATQVTTDRFEWTFNHLFAGKARKVNNNPDIMTWDKAMRSPYRAEMLEAAQNKIDELSEKGTWTEDLKVNATTGIVPCKWVFQIKRMSDGTIRKFKAQIALRGDLQKDTGEDNFSPIKSWSTI